MISVYLQYLYEECVINPILGMKKLRLSPGVQYSLFELPIRLKPLI